MPIAAPVSRGQLHLALDRRAVGVEEPRAVAVDHRPVAVLQIGDAPGQRRQRQRVGADEHLVLAEAHRERRAVLGADRSAPDGRRRSSPARRRPPAGGTRRRRRSTGVHAALQVQIDQLRHRFGVGLGGEFLARRLQLRAQLGVVLDDAVVHDGDARGAVRMRVALGRRAVRRPAGVADAGGAGQRRARPARAARLPSLPSARRRSMWPFTSVAMPALS